MTFWFGDRGNPLAGRGLWRCSWRSDMSPAGLATTFGRIPFSCPLALFTLALHKLLGNWQGAVNGFVKLSQGWRLDDLHDAGKGQQVGPFSPGLAMIAEILEFLEGIELTLPDDHPIQWECSKRSKSPGSLLVMSAMSSSAYINFAKSRSLAVRNPTPRST